MSLNYLLKVKPYNGNFKRLILGSIKAYCYLLLSKFLALHQVITGYYLIYFPSITNLELSISYDIEMVSIIFTQIKKFKYKLYIVFLIIVKIVTGY